MAYRRDVFEKDFTKVKHEIYIETKNFHIDTYTGKSLIPGGTWDFEHIVSAKEFSGLRNVEKVNIETQSKILNDSKNIGFTERTINKSKSKYGLSEWLNKKSNGRLITNSEFYKIDLIKAKRLREQTLNFLQTEIDKHSVK